MKREARAFMLASVAGMASMVWAETMTYDFKYAQYLTSTETTIWENRNLADIESFMCTVKGGWVGTATSGIGVIYDRTATSFTVQFQCVNGGCKAVRAYFRQNGANIVARADRAGLDTDESHYGTRLDDSLFTTDLATSDSANGYGVKMIGAFGDVAQTIAAFPGEADAIVVDGGTLQVSVSGDIAVTTPISGTGGLRFHGSGEPIETQHAFEQYVTTGNQILIEDADVFDIEITSAVFNGGWCGRAEGAQPYNVTSNLEANTMKVQLQKTFTSSYSVIRGLVIQLSQSGDDVVVKGVFAKQAKSDEPLGSDMETWTGDPVYIATSQSAQGYGLESISFVKRTLPTVTLSGTKGWTGGTTADGCKVKVATSQLAASTTARAVNGGVLELAAAGSWDVLPHNVYIAESNSTVRFIADWAMNQADVLMVRGGTVKYDGLYTIYVNDGLFADGAVWRGNQPQVGYLQDAYWRTEGDEDINVFAPLRLVGSAMRKFTLDTAADIVFHGGLVEHLEYFGATFVKCGTAKVTFATGGTIAGPLQIEGGTVVFGGDAGFGPLVLAGSAVIEVAAGKTLSFASSADKEWAAGLQLNLRGAFDSAKRVIRFGTDATGLTSAQQRQIRLNGEPCWIDEDGWLHPGPHALCVIVR